SASFKVFGRGFVVSIWLTTARSIGEGCTSCAPSRGPPCRDAWLVCANCVWTCNASSTRNAAIAGVILVIAKRRRIKHPTPVIQGTPRVQQSERRVSASYCSLADSPINQRFDSVHEYPRRFI